MLGLLVLVIGGLLAWRLIAPGERFLPAFARLLTEPAIKRGPFAFFSGRSYVTGQFLGRDVALRLQLKRSNHGQGYLVLAVKTGGPSAASYDVLDARVRGESGRRALAALASHDLLVSVEDGWLKALWRPQGFVIFPGGFTETRWRQVLESMSAVATALEAT